jgi:hypothetical protein
MKPFYILILSIALSNIGIAQTIHVKLIDGQTKKPVSAVKVKSTHDHDFITFSNDSGYFAFKLKHNDTILLEKDYYYPMFIGLVLHNFDSTHVIQITLTASETIYSGLTDFKKMNLQAFEYHFTHDEVGDNSSAKITLFQTNDALAMQKIWTGGGVKIATVDIFTHSNQKSHYTTTKY